MCANKSKKAQLLYMSLILLVAAIAFWITIATTCDIVAGSVLHGYLSVDKYEEKIVYKLL